MARLRFDDLDKYSDGGGANYFRLHNDRDTATVRIMINRMEDIENYMFSCHRVRVSEDDKFEKNVSCLRNYNDPISKCPLCAAKLTARPKIFIPLYNVEAGEVQFFERGKKFMSKLSGFVSRYSKPTVVSHLVEVERIGKPHDMQTDYNLYETGQDDTRLEDLPEIPDPLGICVLEKSYEEMQDIANAQGDEGYDDGQYERRRGSEDGFMNEPVNDDYSRRGAEDRRTSVNRNGRRSF